jgi:hypothetical protein
MIRIAVVYVALIGACRGSHSSEHAELSRPESSAGSGAQIAKLAKVAEPPPTGPAPKIVWTDTHGEILLASDGDRLSGACNVSGKITPTEVSIGTDSQLWSAVVRDGRAFSIPQLPWKIVVGADGHVIHQAGTTETPLGTVTGLTSDAELRWFGALVVAAPMVQHRLELLSLDGAYKLQLVGAADMRAWEVRSGTTPIAQLGRTDPGPVFADKPAFATDKVAVSIVDDDNRYFIHVTRDDETMKAAFPSDSGSLMTSDYLVTEGSDGALAIRFGDSAARPFAKLVGRQKCGAHREATAALILSFIASKSGHDVVFAPSKK